MNTQRIDQLIEWAEWELLMGRSIMILLPNLPDGTPPDVGVLILHASTDPSPAVGRIVAPPNEDADVGA